MENKSKQKSKIQENLNLDFHLRRLVIIALIKSNWNKEEAYKLNIGENGYLTFLGYTQLMTKLEINVKIEKRRYKQWLKKKQNIA